MAETGILFPVERVELVRGAVLKVSPRNRRHVIATRRVFNFFLERLEGRASVYKEDPLVLKELDSEPEPDVPVCSNSDFEAYGTEATKPLLVVEVAESSLRDDLGDKAALYAEAGIPEYWVVNLVDRVLVVFRDPGDIRYRTRSTSSRARASRRGRGRIWSSISHRSFPKRPEAAGGMPSRAG